MEPNYRFLDTRDQLAEFLSALPAGEPCGLDTEADSLHVYREKICLIQLICADRIGLVDPLRIGDLEILHRFLQDRELWLHGADYDLILWKRTYGYLPSRVRDTQLAARFLGIRELGLAAVLEALFPVSIDKGPQKANWGKRPLDPKMLRYAADDVRYLLLMADRFRGELENTGRWDWFLQSSNATLRNVRDRPDKPADDAWRISGWGKLDPKALAYLHQLWRWRDRIASKWDRPHFKVLGNRQLLDLCRRLAAGEKVQLSPKFPRYVHRAFEKAAASAGQIDERQLRLRKRRTQPARPEDWERVFDTMKGARDSAAEELQIDPALIGSRQALEAWAHADERSDELRSMLFLPWQAEILFGPVLSLS